MVEISSATVHKKDKRLKSRRQKRSRLYNKTWNLVKQVIVPNIKLKTHHNCKYSFKDFFKLLTYAGIRNRYAEGSSNKLNFLSDTEFPNGDTLLYHIKKYRELELCIQYEKAIDQIITIAKQNGLLKGLVDIAIDFTEILYYGDKNDSMVVGTKPKNGTTWAYRFATLTIIEKECRLTIRVIPVGKNYTKDGIVADLVKYAQERFMVGVVCIDRGFNSAEVYSALDNLGVTYITPAVLNSRIIWKMRGQQPPKIIPITIGDPKKKMVTANLVIVLGDDMEKVGFITNMDPDRMHTRKLTKLYKKLWGIETSYRVKKDFRPKTTSKNYIIRLFYFLFSVCLYDLWEIVNIIYSLEDKIDPRTPLISAELFGEAIFRIFKRRGTGPPYHNQEKYHARDVEG